MDNSGLKTIINNLSSDIRDAYKSAFGDEMAHVYTALPSHGLEGLSIGTIHSSIILAIIGNFIGSLIMWYLSKD